MSLAFYLHISAVFDSHLPRHAHAMLRPYRSSQGHNTARPSPDGRAVALRRTTWSEHGMGMAWQVLIKHGRTVYVNQMGKTHSKPLAARHDRGTAWARHAMCESALNRQNTS